MSGLKEKSWKKWKENKTTSPASATEDKTNDSLASQRSSSLIRSRKRNTKRDVAENVFPAETPEIIVPRTPNGDGKNRRVTDEEKTVRNVEQKNEFRNKTTSPFNTLAPTPHPFNRENVVIVQHAGEIGNDKSKGPSDAGQSNELWGELPATDVAESPRASRVKGPKGGSQRPATAKTPHHQPSAPPASPTNEKAPPPPPPPPTPPGPSSNPGRSQFTNPENGVCAFPECPAHGVKNKEKQKERLCMAPECPVTMKKAVVKEAKKAMKKKGGCKKKRRNLLSQLGAVLMSAFAGRDSSCKLTKDEKKALKRMKEAEEYEDASKRSKKSKGTQCRAPVNTTHKAPEKVNKSTACDLPNCPIAIQKKKIKTFLDKGQLCNIPSCPVKQPPPPKKEKKKEKPVVEKVEPAKGCPSKPCMLKAKDEELFNKLNPCMLAKMPRLKMTCEQVFAGQNGGSLQAQDNKSAMRNGDHRSKDKEKGVKIVAAHVRVAQPSENPFLANVSNKPIERRCEEIRQNEDDRIPPKIRFSKVSANEEDSSRIANENATIETRSGNGKGEKFASSNSGESLERKISADDTVDVVPARGLNTSRSFDNEFKKTQSSVFRKLAEDRFPKKSLAPITDTGNAKSDETRTNSCGITSDEDHPLRFVVPMRDQKINKLEKEKTNSRTNGAECSVDRNYNREIHLVEDRANDKSESGTKSSEKREKNDARRAAAQSCTQTLVTSAISPKPLDTIAIGGSSTIDSKSVTPPKQNQNRKAGS